MVFSEAEVAAGHPVATCEADAAAGAISASKPVTPPRSADEADAGAGEVKRPLKRARLGVIASAAAEQWGLDLEGLEHWAQRRQLPGVGVADLLDYRREHPEEDLAAGLSSIVFDGRN